jgi:hypothetical protein
VRSWRTAIVIALCVVPASCGGGGSGTATGSATPGSPAGSPPVRAMVTYRVSGNAPSIVVKYGNKHHAAGVDTEPPWTHAGSAFTGTTVVLEATQPRSRFGYRLQCILTVTIPGSAPIVSRDSSHIVGIKQEGGPQKILYDGQCNTAQVVSLTGLP